MIPLKLQLKNFLSYGPRPQTVDFGPYNLICLSGKNGHGKSALLEAITWSLWGQARKISGTAKPDAQLLRLGQANMMVIFEFEFNHIVYRVKREYSEMYGKPHASLDLVMLDQETKKTHPLTDKTIKHTQEKINTLLGLDFESFINSAFLRQGQSNEFSKKSPKERKEILASILNLDHYEKLRKLAVEKARELASSSALLHHSATRLQEALAEEQTIETAYKDLLQEENIFLHSNETLQKKYTLLSQQKKALSDELQQLSIVKFQYDQVITSIQQKVELAQKNAFIWRTINRKSLWLPSLETLHKQKEALLSQLQDLQSPIKKNSEIKTAFLTLQDQQNNLYKQLHDQYLQEMHQKKVHKERLVEDKKKLITLIEEQTLKKNSCLLRYTELNEALSSLQTLIKESETKQSKIPFIRAQFEKRKTFFHTWTAQANAIKTELINVEQRQKFSIDSTNPSCPLCEQNLSASRKKFLKTKFVKLESVYHHKVKRFTIILASLKQELIKQHTELNELEQQTASLQELHVHYTEREKEKNQIQKDLSEVNAQIDRLSKELLAHDQRCMQEEYATNNIIDFKTVLANNADYQEFTNKLEQLHRELTSIDIYILNQQKIIEELSKLEKQQEEYRQLTNEISLQPQRMNEFKQLSQEIKLLRIQKVSLSKEIARLAELSQQLENIAQEEVAVEKKINEVQKNREIIIQKKGSLDQQKTLIEKQKKEYQEHTEKIQSLQIEIEDYQEIAKAVSKEGIQALLIEDALPEIEQEANVLLSKLTNNQAHIIIDSLRDLKKGGTKETLDIKISDTLGIRPYELFSGGEAFRIDFALRIAISKLLACRSGTSLQTLIIDEGFGSQDEEGIGYIMDALYKIQHHFAKIIIVSHLPSLKDQFPAHFVIEKGADGSNVRIVEQG